MTRPYRAPLRDIVTASPLGTTLPADHDPEPGAVVRYDPPAASGRILRVEPAADLAPGSVNSDLAWAESMARAGIAPRPWNNPHNILWAIGYARALNISVIAAMQGIYISKGGSPTMTAQMMAGLARRAGHRLYVTVDERAHVGGPVKAEFIRKEEIEAPAPARFGVDPVFRVAWDLAKAARASLVRLVDGRPWSRSQGGLKLVWELYPEQMLRARAVSEVLREGAQDILMGMYTPEELGEEVNADGTPVRVDGGAVIDDEFFGAFEGEVPAAAPRTQDPDAPPEDDPGAAPGLDDPFDDDPREAFDAPGGEDGFDPAAATGEDWHARVQETTDLARLQHLWKQANDTRPGDGALARAMTARASQLKTG